MATERYQISLHAVDLPNKGWFRRSSPYAIIKIASGSRNGTDLGETEVVQKCLSPDWCKIFYLDFSPSEVTDLEVNILDYRLGKEPIKMGTAKFEAATVYQSPGNTMSKRIGRKDSSQLYCHVEKSKLGPASGSFHLHLRGLDMKNVEPGPFGLGRSDPFFELSKKNADYRIAQVKWNVIYRSEPIKNNLNPYWKPMTLDLEKVCYGKLDWPLKVTIFDHNDNGDHEIIGEFETTIGDLKKNIGVKGNADRERAIPISSETKFKVYGLICILDASIHD